MRWSKNISAAFDTYRAQYAAIKAVDTTHPVFVLDCPWITAPATEWWVRWNSYGDVSAHDNYAFDYRSTSLGHINGDGGGIPQTVGLATAINNESKPVWACLQAFESGSWLLPTPREMRGQVYAALIHGATGIIYFAMDSLYTRAGAVNGIGPRELLNETYADHSPESRSTATPSAVEMASALWEAVARLNTELLALKPVLFARTSTAGYSVSFAGSTVGNVLGTTNTSTTPIRTLRKRLPGGEEVLLAVNLDRAPIVAKFGVAGLGSSVELMFEAARRVPVVNGSFVDSFDEMDVHVYRL